MREGRPSQTAAFVALVRALADDGFTTVPAFHDPIARRMLSPSWTLVYRGATAMLRKMRPADREKAITDYAVIPLRVVAIDREIERAIANGARQLVILGAGFDTRALRLASLADVDVFEIDHPATQRYKRRKTEGLTRCAKTLSFVEIDFERSGREPLVDSLVRAGFRPDAPSIWIWEGVVMYLTEAAVRATLGEIARASAPGSTLVVHYHEPDGGGFVRERRLRRVLLGAWREPQIGKRPSRDIHEWVQHAGFTIARDTRPAEWAESCGAPPPGGQIATVTHLLVATRGVVT